MDQIFADTIRFRSLPNRNHRDDIDLNHHVRPSKLADIDESVCRQRSFPVSFAAACASLIDVTSIRYIRQSFPPNAPAAPVARRAGTPIPFASSVCASAEKRTYRSASSGECSPLGRYFLELRNLLITKHPEQPVIPRMLVDLRRRAALYYPIASRLNM